MMLSFIVTFACFIVHSSEVVNYSKICNKNNSDLATVSGLNICICKPGFYPNETKETCIDINECLDKNICPDKAVCENSFGSFKCICPDDYIYNQQQNSCEIRNVCQRKPYPCGLQNCCKMKTSDSNDYECEPLVYITETNEYACKAGFSAPELTQKEWQQISQHANDYKEVETEFELTPKIIEFFNELKPMIKSIIR